jgi:hypothetical protein
MIDRYLSIEDIDPSQGYLLASTALFIASKYEDIIPPTVNQILKLTRNQFSRDQLFEMERGILYNLEFQVLTTSSFRFIERYSKIAKADTVSFFLAQFFLELALFDSKMA